MAKKFRNLVAKMPPRAQAEIRRDVKKMLREMPLYELRKARAFSQEKIAKTLHVKQASVSKLERRADMYLSTLRSYVEAMGGKLELVAKFPEGAVRIKQFEDLEDNEKRRATG